MYDDRWSPQRVRLADCGRIDRRGFFKLGAAACSLPWFVRQTEVLANGGLGAGDVRCIFIWTQGGTSHHDTLDPKPLASDGVRGPFRAIPTAVPGVQFTEICPRLASELNRFSVLRSWNPRNAGHGVADQWCMSGRRPNPALTYPCIGSVVSHQFGFKSALPPFVQLGSYIDRTSQGGTPGILGLEHAAFEIHAEANVDKFAVRDITPPMNMELSRVDRRKTILAGIDRLQRTADLQPAAYDALDQHYQAAFNMITSPHTKQAFDIGSESAQLRDAYGRTALGQRLLLSRRLIEAGVRFVTVTDPGWDNHQDCFNALKGSRMPQVDQGLPQLLIDLQERGLLDTTLVVWMTDFGRTPKINSASGRDHWASAGFVVMAGAGIPGGLVIGETDAEGSVPTRNEYFTENVVATIYRKLGLPLDLTVIASDSRPIRLIEGEPIKEWTA
ncbi:MAG: DUF1501 domain-containing protein [Pirellulales bacterium]